MAARTSVRVRRVAARITSAVVLWIAGCDSAAPPIVGTIVTSGMGAAGAGGVSGSGTAGHAGVGGAAGESSSAAGGGGVGGTDGMTTVDSAGAPAPAGGTGGAPSAGTSGGSAGASGTAAAPGFPPVSDLGADGPYMATTVQRTGPNGNYTIYHPADLAPGGAKNPVVGWMSGGGSNPAAYALLPHLATHGFVIVASNTTPSIGAEVSLGEEIIASIDWILAENAKSDSMFFEKLDATKIASMGYSMGALATTTIAGDPRLTTTVHISGGNMVTDRIEALHAPAAFICGASGVDIAGAGCATDFEAATAPVFYGVFKDGGHLGVQTEPYAGRIQLVVTGWLRWQLMSDASLEPMFVGDQCTVCKDPNWIVMQKGLI